MVESVDTRDLKSLGYCSCVGSSPTPGTTHIYKPIVIQLIAMGFSFLGSPYVAQHNDTLILG